MASVGILQISTFPEIHNLPISEVLVVKAPKEHNRHELDFLLHIITTVSYRNYKTNRGAGKEEEVSSSTSISILFPFMFLSPSVR
jgi:hypothetical protein